MGKLEKKLEIAMHWGVGKKSEFVAEVLGEAYSGNMKLYESGCCELDLAQRGYMYHGKGIWINVYIDLDDKDHVEIGLVNEMELPFRIDSMVYSEMRWNKFELLKCEREMEFIPLINQLYRTAKIVNAKVESERIN